MSGFEELERLIERVEILMPLGDEAKIDAAFHELLDEVNRVTNMEYRTAEDFAMFFRVNRLIAENFIRTNDNLTLSVRMMEWSNVYKDMMEHLPMNDDERQSVQREYQLLLTTFKDYMQKEEELQQFAEDEYDHMEAEGTLPDDGPIELEWPKHDDRNERPEGCRCLLCRKNMADEVGSHMVPNCLIDRLFACDGSKEREKAVVERYIGIGQYTRYIGRDITDDKQVVGLINRRLRDDEQGEEGAMHNPLTFDRFFCKECEKRFSTIESLYARIAIGSLKKYPPAIPYLFWMSVTWRMSIAKLGICLPPKHEEKYRVILDKALARNEKEILTDICKLGHCAYTIAEADDTKEETLGIMGIPVPTAPAIYLIGNKEIRFYHSLDKARKLMKKTSSTLTLNCGTEPEIVDKISFTDFFDIKRYILDTIYSFDSQDNKHGISTTGIAQIFKYENAEKEMLDKGAGIVNFKRGIENDGEKEGKYVLSLPRAMTDVMMYSKAHPDVKGEELAKALGYTKEELEHILSISLNESRIINL